MRLYLLPALIIALNMSPLCADHPADDVSDVTFVEEGSAQGEHPQQRCPNCRRCPQPKRCYKWYWVYDPYDPGLNRSTPATWPGRNSDAFYDRFTR